MNEPVCAVTRVVFWRENAWPTALPAAFVRREVASPTALEKKKKKKKQQKKNFEDDKIQSIFLYMSNSRRKRKATSGGRNKSTCTSSESGSEIILLRSGATKRWMFPLEVKRFAHFVKRTEKSAMEL